MTPKQMSLSMQHDVGFERHLKATRRDVSLAEMDQVYQEAKLQVHRRKRRKAPVAE